MFRGARRGLQLAQLLGQASEKVLCNVIEAALRGNEDADLDLRPMSGTRHWKSGYAASLGQRNVGHFEPFAQCAAWFAPYEAE
jgi:hypothetical protein